MLREITVPAGASVPDLVERAMLRCSQEYGEALSLPHTSYVEQAHRAEQLATVCERRARWWGVLLRWIFSPDCALPWVFGAAVLDARRREEDDARFWRNAATEWHAEYTARVIGDPFGRMAGRAS
jgi:hypothetical protein